MLIGALLLELSLPDADSIKAKRRVVKSLVERISSRFKVSVAEVADHDDWHAICIGCVRVGVEPQHLRASMDHIVRFVDGLGLAELVDQDVVVAALDEFRPVENMSGDGA